MRIVAKKYRNLSLADVLILLKDPIHEFRLLALLILVDQFRKGNQKKIVAFYLKHKRCVNNWDLVDTSAPVILGEYSALDRSLLYVLAKSSSLWDRRIAMLATFGFIKKKEYKDALALAEFFLSDRHDLMHKAVGWMLREIGKRDILVLESFLDKHASVMPRTMLRYALEKFDEKKRKKYMGMKPTS